MIDVRHGTVAQRRAAAAPTLWLLVIGLLLAVGMASDRLVRTAGSTGFLEHALGAQRGDAPLVRRPARGVTVRLGKGYSVSVRGEGRMALSAEGASGRWSRFSGGVSRPTAYGREAITVGATRTEEFLQVSRHQGVRTWQWRLQSPGLTPSLTHGGTVLFTRNDRPVHAWIPPVRILDAGGKTITPAGLRWSLRRADGRWSLVLRLDDRKLPVPYVIDPAIDYPTLYLSSAVSTASNSWRLVTSAPSGADSSTSTSSGNNGTGNFAFRPGLFNNTNQNQGTTPKGYGWIQDLAGGTGFVAGNWSFTVETQIPSTNLVAGTAILSFGVWKGTIGTNGAFHSTQTILPPTDDPAAQNIRASLGVRTTTVTYSLPAFSLAANERLEVEIWRRQLTGIPSGNQIDRQVNLIVNDGVGKIDHPATDDTSPVNAFSIANVTGGAYLNNPGGTGGTLYYRGTAAGSFQLQDTASDTGAGVQQVTYPATSANGWTHPAQTVTTGPNYPSTYSWTAGASSAGAQAIVAQDYAVNRTTGTVTITNDTTAPTTPSVALTSPPAWYTAASVALTPTDGTDNGSGLDTSTRVYQRDETGITNGACNAFPNTWAATVSNPDATVADGRCYRYRLRESDRVGNQSAASAASGTAKVDLNAPTAPALAFSALTNASASGSTVYYRPTVSGSFAVTATSSDSASGVSGYTFATPPTWTVTGTAATRTYAWTSSSNDPGSVGVFATDVAGYAGSASDFTPTPDATLPSTTDNTASIGSGWHTTAQTVTLTPTDSGSGVAGTYYTTDGSTPTTGSPSGTSISLTADGVYTIKYFSVDNVGNQEPVRTASTVIRIDRVGPSVTMTALPPSIGNGQVLTATATDALSGTQSVSYYYCSPSPCTPTTLIGSSTSGPNYSVTWNSQPPDGVYDVRAGATDVAGNTGTSATQTVSIGNAAPDTTITAQPSNPSNNPNPSFSFTSSKPNSTFECKLDAGAYAGCTSPRALSGLADGSHTFSVRAIDSGGNVDATPAAYTWTIDTVPPDTTITSQPPNPSGSSTATFSFTSPDPGSTFLCQLDGGLLGTCSSPVTYVGLADGSHTFRVTASDAAGNSDPTPATYTWSIDSGAPDTTITSSPSNPSNDSAPSFAFTSTKPNSTFQCRLDGAAAVACTSPTSYSGLADGSHTFTVAATDAAGNTDPSPATYTWTIDTSGNTNTVDEVHYTFTGPTSVAFDWRGSPTGIRYGLTNTYGSTATAHEPTPLPFSSPGPFREVELTGLAPGTTYHYSIGGGLDHTFSTAPTGNFRFDVIADVGSTLLSPKVATVAGQVAGDVPAFVLVPGDITYANAAGQSQASVDQHFNDEMAWSQIAAYMPSWGNHEWDTPTLDDLRNYKGRFMLPHAQAVPSAPAPGCCGEDWGWFDAGGVRFISYPEQYSLSTASEWQTAADPVFAAAQADPNIHFIVTYGHEPAYSTGLHSGNAGLASAIDSFGDRYPKYVLNMNGHSHDYERFQPIHGVTHITTGGATSLETPWQTTDPRTVVRAFHLEHLRIDVSPSGMRVDAICGPSTSFDDTTCLQGDVLDSVTFGSAPPPPPPTPTLYVDNGSSNCTDTGLGTQD